MAMRVRRAHSLKDRFHDRDPPCVPWRAPHLRESLAVLLRAEANAKDPAWALTCTGCRLTEWTPKMQVYLPQSLVNKGDQAVRKMKPTIG